MATACEINSLTSKCKFKNTMKIQNTNTRNVKELQVKYTCNSFAQGVID